MTCSLRLGRLLLVAVGVSFALNFSGLAAPSTQPASKPVPRVSIPKDVAFRVPSPDELAESPKHVFVLDLIAPPFAGKNADGLGPQLVGAINRLQETQSFNLLAVGAGGVVKFSPDVVPANEANKKKAETFLTTLKVPARPVVPGPAIAAALAVPGYRTIVTDHAWANPTPVVNQFSNQWKASIGTRFIYFVPGNQPFDAHHDAVLSQLAEDLGGQYMMVQEKDLKEK